MTTKKTEQIKKKYPNKKMMNQYCINTNNTTKNNNVPIESTIFQQYQKNYNTSIQQQYETNTDKTKNNKSSLQNNGQNKKYSPRTSTIRYRAPM